MANVLYLDPLVTLKLQDTPAGVSVLLLVFTNQHYCKSSRVGVKKSHRFGFHSRYAARILPGAPTTMSTWKQIRIDP